MHDDEAPTLSAGLLSNFHFVFAPMLGTQENIAAIEDNEEEVMSVQGTFKKGAEVKKARAGDLATVVAPAGVPLSPRPATGLARILFLESHSIERSMER